MSSDFATAAAPSPSPTYILAVTSTSLPVTSAFALPLTSFHLLSQHLAIQRASSSAAAASNEAFECPAGEPHSVNTIPLAIILAGLVELNGGSKKVLAGAVSGWLAFNALLAAPHLLGQQYTGTMKRIGYYGAQGALAGLAFWAGYLPLLKNYGIP